MINEDNYLESSGIVDISSLILYYSLILRSTFLQEELEI